MRLFTILLLYYLHDFSVWELSIELESDLFTERSSTTREHSERPEIVFLRQIGLHQRHHKRRRHRYVRRPVLLHRPQHRLEVEPLHDDHRLRMRHRPDRHHEPEHVEEREREERHRFGLVRVRVRVPKMAELHEPGDQSD